MASKKAARPRVRDDFDGAWKNMLSEARFAAFTQFFLPDVYGLIDWKRGVEFLEQELRAITRKTRRGSGSVDRLVKVWLKSGEERWVLVHVEIQAQEDDAFVLRMFRYRSRILDRFGEVPVACLAVLGDKNSAWKPDAYVSRFWGTEISFHFRTVKLLDYADRLADLEQSANPFARFVVAHLKTLQTQGDYESRLEWKLRIIQSLYDMGVSQEEIGRLAHDFDWLLALPEPMALRYHTSMTRFEEEKAMPHLSTAERIGRKIGREEGREEGRRGLLHDQLAEKFGSLPDGTVARLEAMTADELDRLGRQILTAQTLAELGL
jgi:hypothetical protein